jgi:hypothetical protein
MTVATASYITSFRVFGPSGFDSVTTATNATNALTASFITASNVWGPLGANSIISASFAQTASFVRVAQTASFVTASNIQGPFGANSVTSASFAATASFLLGSISNAITADTASYVLSSGVFGPSGLNSILTASYALNAGTVLTGSLLTTASATNNDITFTKGNGDQFNVTLIPFPFSGSATITGSLVVSGSGLTVIGSLSATSITGSLLGTASWATNAITSLRPIDVTGSTLYSTTPAAGPGISANNNIALGTGSGFQATSANDSIFLGRESGYNATDADNSIFLGYRAGYLSSIDNSKFIGQNGGNQATSA